MFYKHLHDPSCDLFMHGEEAPQSKEAQLQAALDAEREKRLTLERITQEDVDRIATLQAQLRQVEHDAETYRKMHTVCTMNLALANNELTTLRQLVSALPVVDVQEVSVWLSPDESGWLVSKRPAFPAGLYWAKFRTQAEADSFRALLAYRATLQAQLRQVEEALQERKEFIADCDTALDRIQAPRTNEGQEELVSTWRRIELLGKLLYQYRQELERSVPALRAENARLREALAKVCLELECSADPIYIQMGSWLRGRLAQAALQPERGRND